MKGALGSWGRHRSSTPDPPPSPRLVDQINWDLFNSTIHRLHAEMAHAMTDTAPPPQAPSPPSLPDDLPHCYWKSNRARLPVGQVCEDLQADYEMDQTGRVINVTQRLKLAVVGARCQSSYLLGYANTSLHQSSVHSVRAPSRLAWNRYNHEPNSYVEGMPLPPHAELFYSRCAWLDSLQSCMSLFGLECANSPPAPPGAPPPTSPPLPPKPVFMGNK